jgi:hypothetical protein
MAPEVPGEIVRDSERLTILLKRHAEKKTFTKEEDLEEAIRMARYDSFLVGPEMAAGKRVTKLRANVFVKLKQFPAYLNRWDSQQARNEGVFAH